MATAPAQWDESTAVPVSGQSQQWDESTAVPLRPAAPAPQAAPGPQPAAAPAPPPVSAQPPAPRQPDTIGPAPEPGRIERARQWLVNSNPGQMLERNAPGVASALGLTPTESDAARQERHATDTFPYHPIQAAEQIDEGMRVNQGYADAYDKLAGEHPDWDEGAVEARSGGPWHYTSDDLRTRGRSA